MIEQIAIAFENKDYKTAAKLLKPLLQDSPDNPWVVFYLARLHEVSGKYAEAEKVYRRLLLITTNNKIVTQTRQGLQRLEDIRKEEKQRAIAQATSEPSNTELGVLILEPLDNEQKNLVAANFAQIMQLDAYTARLLLPTRSWKYYRAGRIGELKFYGMQLQQAGIPCFWITIKAIAQIQVYQVQYFSESQPKPTVICSDQRNIVGSLTFDWAEVSAQVLGLLPIFEEVVDVNANRQFERKTKTQDYAQFCDLHLPQRHCILRMCDRSYDFHQSLEITPAANQNLTRSNWTPSVSQNTIRINWNNLVTWLTNYLPQATIWSDFTPFAETVLEQMEMLGNIQSHIHLFRRDKTYWDPAFHLYSGLIFNKDMAQNH
ncbi:cyclic nucleotide-binding protein [Nostoc sp. CENA543]|uniref:tetratricopeptide repeat protein n=1 Tax=Nostoc sp. CENA543 TaxID=1869241 RepID=UPI000CA144AA|nr:tetratricopeptide repeat protein [Nostoc sp. CENA543]AUT03840.1 cyclic nucleotide-binding protein [Nostoc sp. CENA543]